MMGGNEEITKIGLRIHSRKKSARLNYMFINPLYAVRTHLKSAKNWPVPVAWD